jgi:hypothetical protein
MGDFDEIDDLDDNGALGGSSSSLSEEWNPGAVAILPVLCKSTKEILVAVDVDELGIKLKKEVN